MKVDLTTLNEAQREAVLTTEGPVLVLAGAGSGKTRVVVHRIAYLLEQGVPPEAILAVTFTNKAAAEMRERVVELLGSGRAEGLTVSTFHSFGLQLLRAHASRLGYGRRFAIFDTQDQQATLKRILAQVSVAGRDLDLKRLHARISLLKNGGITPEAFAARAKLDDDYDLALSELYPRYQEALLACNAVDFDDLLLLPLRLIEEEAEVRAELQARYRYQMVDEYQDTSKMQLRFLRGLVGEGGNVCVVGDDDQSIYAWRGAEVDNILRFESSFKGAREIKLTRNYRSTSNILDAANAVISLNSKRRGKDLWTESGAGDPIRVVPCVDDEQEAEFVAAEIAHWVAVERRSYDDFAILFRTNGQSRPFEEALRARGIPHRIVGGTRFFDRKEVRDALAYLKVCLNPKDDVSLARIVNYPPRGIGDSSLGALHTWARTRGRSLWDALRRVHEVPGCERAEGAIIEFVDLIERYHHRLSGGGLTTPITDLFSEIELGEAARASVKSAAAGASKAANVDALVASVARYEKKTPRPSLAQFLARVALDGGDEEAPAKGQLTLLTFHGAKGLEFPTVFMVGMEEGLLPHSGMQGAAQDLPEERRLAYVGITRARERLYLTRAQTRLQRGRSVPRTPSRFFEDLPPHTFEEVSPEGSGGPLSDQDIEVGREFFAQIQAMLAGNSDQ